MTKKFSFVHEALALFSPENGLDEQTAANLLRHQLQAATWQEGLLNELAAMLHDDTTDWLSVVDNETFCMGEFEGPEDARAFVVRLLGPFVPSQFAT